MTPRVGATTQQSRVRSAWAVARRIDDLLLASAPRAGFRPTLPGEFVGIEDVQRLPEVGQPRLFLRDHRGRRTRHETRIAELGLGLRDLALQPRDFLVQPRPFDGRVDGDEEGQPQVARHRHRCGLRRRREGGLVGQQPHLGQTRQRLQQR